MATSSENPNAISQNLEKADEALRVKYRDILDSLTINELKRFKIDKHKYKQIIISELLEIVPEADSKQVDETAHYISNFLANEAPK